MSSPSAGVAARDGGVGRGAHSATPSDPALNMSMRSRLLLLLGDRRGSVLILMITAIFSGFAESATLAVLAETAATVTSGSNRAHIHIGLVHAHPSVDTLFAIALGLVIIRVALQIPLLILPPRIISDMQSEMRVKLFHAFSRASWEVQASDREGQLQATVTGQVGGATSAVISAIGLITSSVLLIILLLSALALNPIAAGFVVVLTLVLFALLRPLRKSGVHRSRALSRAQLQYGRGIAESVRLAEETQVFGAGAALRERTGRLVATVKGHTIATQILLRLAANLYAAVISLVFVGALFLLFELGKGHAASLGAVVIIVVRASSSGQNVQAAYQGLVQSTPYVERVQEAEARYRDSMPVQGSVPLVRVDTLAFEGVGYAYRPGRPVLSDVSFEVNGEEVIGVIGPSGAGKSTLVQLLLRLRAPAEGRYLVNGTPAQEIAQADWYRHVAYVPQEPQLLHASVADNIRFFRDIDDEAVERAGRLARIHDDIIGWTDGYDTIVGPRADAVSGGQQQRICLARALVARPEVLVLDEPTSALDPTSEALIQESLTGLKKQLTMFIIAHRMSTLNICDRVMIIIDGKLTAFDTINYLQQHNPYYRSASQHANNISGAAVKPDHGSDATVNTQAVTAVMTAPAAADVGSAPVAAPAPRARARVPDFFIVGHPKSGTTALYEALRRHPQIYMPDGKEPWFFAPELHERTPPRPEGTPATLEEYLSLFAAATPEQRIGEATALYLWSQTAASRIAEVRPDARIIAILREPASFLRSLHLQFVQTYVETEGDLRRALSLEQERRRGESIPRHSYWPQALLYSKHVRYVEQLRRYHDVFAAEQVLVLIYDDFQADNEGTVRQVLRFLDVDDTAPVEVPHANPTVRARSQRLHELVHALSVGRGPGSLAVKATVKAFTPRRLRREALYATQRHLVFADPGPADEELMSELRRRFKGEVVALSEYLGRDLVSLWHYDSVSLD
jgi:ATP-binding cassette, subfamily B, bacterial